VKKRTAWILVAAVAAVAIGAAAVGSLALLLRGGGGGGLTSSNYLFVRLEGDVPEQPPGSELEAVFERRPPSLRSIVESLDRGAFDPKVTGALLRVSALPDSGWGKVQELRDAVTRFRKSGKPAYAHLEFCGNKEYYLATACNKIYAVPTALIGVSGLEAEVTFLRQTLDKLGVQAQFEGVGKYKNAPNQFTEAGFTPPHREQMDALLDSLYGQYIDAIASSRGKTPEQVRALVDAGPYDAAGAKEAGLVDELLYQDQAEEKLHRANRTTPARYLRAVGKGLGWDNRPHIALVYAVGEIVPGDSQSSGGLSGDGLAGSDTVAGALRQAREDGDVRAILLRVDSPGGFGPAADVIWREVQVARKSKPVIVSMGDYAASGGYYIAMGSDGIVAQPGTITGSIGVFSGKFNLHGLYDKLGLTKEILTRGKHAALYSEYRPWSDEERAKIRQQMVAFYKDFVSRVAEGRKRSYEQVDAIAQGRVWTGAEAKHNGLVDELGGFDVALSLAKKKAGIPKGQPVVIQVFPERKGFFEALLERQDESASVAGLPGDLTRMIRWLRLLSDGAPMARLPFELRVR
jgi:protease-4